ncbi:MAG: TetR/AcrR family transcriptional regulator [Acidimicrobiales bacterium]
MEDASGARRLTRTESRAQTRERLLDAAATAFASDGYSGASVEEIAESAGFSVGALYSNFAGKEQLFAEVLRRQRADRMARVHELFSSPGSLDDHLRALSRLLGEFADRGLAINAVHGGVGPRGFRDPEAERVVRAFLQEQADDIGSMILLAMAREGVVVTASPTTVSTVVTATIQGLVRRRKLDATSATDDVIYQALTWLTVGVAASA